MIFSNMIFKRKKKRGKLTAIGKQRGWQAAAHQLFIDLLEDMTESDVRIYFSASTDSARDIIRGAYLRNKYLIKKLKQHTNRPSEGEEEISDTGMATDKKLNSPRYG